MQGGGSVADECNIDAEIEDTEKEIRRLSMRLESLRMEKIERDLRVSTAQRGRIVPAKFMERKACPASKKEESQAIAGMRRRGFSLGPLEIHGSAGKSSIRKLDSVKEEILSTSPPFVNAKTDTKCCKKKTADFSTDSSSVGYRRRGLSLGPSEIASISRSRFPSRLQEVKDRGKPEKRQSSSVSPKAQNHPLTN
ncbi:hypothetical protein HPP92_010842 [Vanilla planifolia]|uniref:Uncharacterized protein n=1 Tax=Vanilla planifolia TaxID=51239 RepID=A0A835R362_VANPL|nr:hypothetical protein HPP92_010842 [Vanilla planifolia]